MVQAQDDDNVILGAFGGVEREQIELLGSAITATELRLCCPRKNPALIKCLWAAAGFDDTLLRWQMKPEVVNGEKKDIQSRVQTRGGQTGR